MGIEPTALAWEARVLPLYDARSGEEVRHSMLIGAVFQPVRSGFTALPDGGIGRRGRVAARGLGFR